MLDAPLLIEFATPKDGLPGVGASHFVVGVENRLLLAVLRHLLPVSSFPDDATATNLANFNPLVLVGPTGVGKTALVEQGASQRRRPWIGTASTWGRDYQEALAADRLVAWRKEMAAYEMVVVEDLDRTTLSARVQRELRYAIDAIMAAGGQMVFTAQREPGQWQRLAEGLRDRLAGGLMIPLRYPGEGARRSLWQLAAQSRQMTLSPTQLDRLVAQTNGSPRRLWGALASLDIGWDEASTPTRPNSTGRNSKTPTLRAPHTETDTPQSLTLKHLIAAAARYFGVSPKTLTGSSRRRSLVQARGVTIHVIRQTTRFSYAQIGAALGGRDHTTILHADRRIAATAASDSKTQFDIDELQRILGT